MISLVMDTSNQYLVVGLYRDNECLESFQEKGTRRQSENAIPALKGILDRHQVTLKDIDEMIITWFLYRCQSCDDHRKNTCSCF